MYRVWRVGRTLLPAVSFLGCVGYTTHTDYDATDDTVPDAQGCRGSIAAMNADAGPDISDQGVPGRDADQNTATFLVTAMRRRAHKGACKDSRVEDDAAPLPLCNPYTALTSPSTNPHAFPGPPPQKFGWPWYWL